MRIAENFRPMSKVMLWLRRAFDVMVVGAMALALLETVRYLTGLTRLFA